MEITHTLADDGLHLTITGRLDGYWADDLDRSLTEIVREGHHRLRLDLSGVTFLSSAGIGVLVKFYKRLAEIKGALSVSRVSPVVKTVLDITHLTGTLVREVSPAAPETFLGRVLVRDGLALQVFEQARGATLALRTCGDAAGFGSSAASGTALQCPASRMALGVGAFGATHAECHDRHGEFLAICGAAACLPGDGTEAPDYLVASDGGGPVLHVLRGIACDGPFAWHFRFDPGSNTPKARLSQLAAAAVELAGGAAGLVVVAEAAGLVGASLRRSPAAAAPGDLFAFPGIRNLLTFSAERTFARTLALVVGVAQRGEGTIPAEHLRPLDATGELLGHFHAAAFPYQPFKKGRVDLRETVCGLFAGGEVLGLLHLLQDDRAIVGVGESEFTRGACWAGPIAGGQADHP